MLRKIKDKIKKKMSPRVIPIEHIVEDKQQLKGKVALVAGGTGGIGYAIAKKLSEVGCKVIVSGTNKEKLTEISKKLNCKTIILDYSDTNSLPQSISNAVRCYGKLDFFISSVGVHTENTNFFNMSNNEFKRVMQINLEGTYFACQLVSKYMIQNKVSGRILIISSSRGSEPAWSPYGISKWGLNGLIEGIAKLLLPYGIVVNGIAPGPTATALVGYKDGDSIYAKDNFAYRYVMPEEVANLAKYLICDSGEMIVGEIIHISGGRGTVDIR